VLNATPLWGNATVGVHVFAVGVLKKGENVIILFIKRREKGNEKGKQHRSQKDL